MKWFSTRNHGKQQCLQQIVQKVHKVIANLQKNQYVIIYHYIDTMKIIFIDHLKLASGTHTEWVLTKIKTQ